jgi:hypothetical protein
MRQVARIIWHYYEKKDKTIPDPGVGQF